MRTLQAAFSFLPLEMRTLPAEFSFLQSERVMSDAPIIHVPPTGEPSALKRGLKATARFAALVGVSPVLLSYRVNAALLGRGRALESRSQLLSLWPGLTGQYLRRAFLQQVLARCH